jgi:hypothetical protein
VVAIADRTLTERDRHDLRVETRRINGRDKYFIPERSRLGLLESATRVSRTCWLNLAAGYKRVGTGEPVTLCPESCSKEKYALRLVHTLQPPIRQHYL